MKVLHVITSLSPKQGGTTTAVRAMAQAVAKQGVEVHVAATDDDNMQGRLRVPLEQPLDENGVTHWYFRRQTRRYGFSWPLTQWLAQHISDYDLVHVHGLFIYSSLIAARYSVQQSIPYVISSHGILNKWGLQNGQKWFKQLSLRLFERPLLFVSAAAWHFTCEQEQLEARAIYSALNNRSIIIPLGIPLNAFQQMPSTEQFLSRYPGLRDMTRLLFLSRIDPKKGLDLLLPAFAEVQKQFPDTVLIMAGNGEQSYLSELERLTTELGIAHKVIWPGFLEGTEKLAAMGAADLFILPSYSENFGLAVVEAMAAGLPVAISDQVGMYREVGEAEAGLIMHCSEEAIITALHELLSNGALRQRMALNGKALAAATFNLDAMATRLVKLYDDIVNNKVI